MSEEHKRVEAVKILRTNILTELENMVVDLELEGEILTIWASGAPSAAAGDVFSHSTTKVMGLLLKFVKEAEGAKI